MQEYLIAMNQNEELKNELLAVQKELGKLQREVELLLSNGKLKCPLIIMIIIDTFV